MPYLIHVTSKPGTKDIFHATLEEHREYLTPFIPRMLATGALLEEEGERNGEAIIIFDTEDRFEAQNFIDNDPLTLAGIFESVRVSKWRKYIYNGEIMPNMEKF